MSQENVDRATKALWDYIDSLPPDRRAQAIAYQRDLEAKAATAEGGMQAVIETELAEKTQLLAKTMNELHELAADHAAGEVIRGIMAKP